MHELQALGVALAQLSELQLETIEIPEKLREAILEAKRIKSHEAKRRQMQYIGRLMRDIDAAPIRSRLAEVLGRGQRHFNLEEVLKIQSLSRP